MGLTQSAWDINKAKLQTLITDAEEIKNSLQFKISGFQPANYTRRCSAGHCVHQGYFHISSGWNPGNAAFAPGHYRTKDFITAEKSIELPNVVFTELASLKGKIWRGTGLNDLVWTVGDDLTTNEVYVSENGSEWALSPNSIFPREVCGFISDEDYIYVFLGESYNPTGSPIYDMPRDAWRTDGTTWELRNTDLGIARRSFAQIFYNNKIFIIGGADDTYFPSYRLDYNEIYASDDGLLTITQTGTFPFTGYGMRAAHFNGGVVVLGGAGGNPLAYTDKVYFSNDPDLDTWTEMSPLPQAFDHCMTGALVIDGVETLAVIGGYNHYTGGLPLGTIYTTTDLITWTARTESDFWKN